MGTTKIRYVVIRNAYLMIIVMICMLAACKTRETPKKYRNNTTVSPIHYKLHIQLIEDSMHSFIRHKIKPYYPVENDSSTKIFVDTILYSPLKNKIAFFVISQNSNDKLIGNSDTEKYHYNANCFIAHLSNDNKINGITWLNPYNLTRYPSLKEASKDIRIMHFNNFKGKGSSKLRYNLDDIRFWDDNNIWGN